MPRKPIDYSNSIIYTISKGDLVYVGSTTKYTQRKWTHRVACNSENNKAYNYPVYKMIRENGGWDTFVMKPYKVFPCKTKMELLVEEERVMRELKAPLNTVQAITTEEERKEQKNEAQKGYYVRHLPEVKEYQKHILLIIKMKKKSMTNNIVKRIKNT